LSFLVLAAIGAAGWMMTWDGATEPMVKARADNRSTAQAAGRDIINIGTVIHPGEGRMEKVEPVYVPEDHVDESSSFHSNADADDGPRITVEDERWLDFLGRALILEMKMRIENGPRPFQITSYTFEGHGGSGGYPSGGEIGTKIMREVFERQDTLGQPLRIVDSYDKVSLWVVNAFGRPPINKGGTPGFTFTIYDAVGNEYRLIRNPQEKNIKPIGAIAK